MSSQQIRNSRRQALLHHAGELGAWEAMLTLEAIEALTAADGRPPTYREVAASRQLTVGGIQQHTAVLVKAGLLTADKTTRSFRVVDTGTHAVEDWHDVLRVTLSPEDTSGDVAAVILYQVEEAIERLDLRGSQIEIVIRHKP